MPGGLLVSTTQCLISPSVVFSSNLRKQCGLAQTHSVTAPFTVTVLSVLNSAFPWCASWETETIRKVESTAAGVINLFFIGIASILSVCLPIIQHTKEP